MLERNIRLSWNFEVRTLIWHFSIVRCCPDRFRGMPRAVVEFYDFPFLLFDFEGLSASGWVFGFFSCLYCIAFITYPSIHIYNRNKWEYYAVNLILPLMTRSGTAEG